MVESKFSLFQVHIERVLGHAIELRQAAFCIAPDKLNAVGMSLPIANSFSPWCPRKCLSNPMSTRATPAIGVNYRAGLHMAADNALQRGFGAVRHDLGIDLALPLNSATRTQSSFRKPRDCACREPDGHRSTTRRLLPHPAAATPVRRIQQHAHESSGRYCSQTVPKFRSIRPRSSL